MAGNDEQKRRIEISYSSKEESKRAQEEAFLALSPAERIEAFFRLSRRMLRFSVQDADRDFELRSKGNFILEKGMPPDANKTISGD